MLKAWGWKDVSTLISYGVIGLTPLSGNFESQSDDIAAATVIYVTAIFQPTPNVDDQSNKNWMFPQECLPPHKRELYK